MTDHPMETSGEDSRLARLEAEVRGLKKFVTTLEIGHENRARQWNRKIAQLSTDVKDLQDRVRRTRKKVKKLRKS